MDSNFYSFNLNIKRKKKKKKFFIHLIEEYDENKLLIRRRRKVILNSFKEYQQISKYRKNSKSIWIVHGAGFLIICVTTRVGNHVKCFFDIRNRQQMLTNLIRNSAAPCEIFLAIIMRKSVLMYYNALQLHKKNW
ncbi:hypothetical protein RCL_jg22489.t1 [Rhizophagus clarus]|uniref:Uncharacterized protein n=1 Tax=Rhizophagus clarus TaxID=94130 RepID=A0A8H3MFR6_9GLOM|nr:hypothetical protein RCL_jg22489.t1 [Rhizophagus clarus]